MRNFAIYPLAVATALLLIWAAPPHLSAHADSPVIEGHRVVATSETWAGDSYSLAGDDSRSFENLQGIDGFWIISSDGEETAVTWGPELAESGAGRRHLPEKNDPVAFPSNSPLTPHCTMLVSDMSYSSGKLRASTQTTCAPNIPKSTSAIAQRRNAVAIWVDYGVWGHTSLNLDNPQTTIWPTSCSGTSGPWRYALLAGSYAEGIGASPRYRGGYDSEYHCGT